MAAEHDGVGDLFPLPGGGWLAAPDEPFQRPGLLRRISPFALGAFLAELSLALPPGPKSAPATVASVALLVVTAIAVLLPYDRLPPGTTVTAPVVYMGSVLALVLATGSSSSGVGIMIVIPLVWTALYHRPWESAVVVALIVAFEVVVSMVPEVATPSVFIRRVVFGLLLGAIVSGAVHALRQQLLRALGDERQLRRQTAAMTAAAQELTAILDPDRVLFTATRLLAELSAIAEGRPRRSQYFTAHDGRVEMTFQYDHEGRIVDRSWPLEEQPWLAQVISTREARHGAVDPELAGPTVRSLLVEMEITHAVWVPVTAQGEVHGVLCLSGKGDVGPRLFQLCQAVGFVTELALRNALTHQKLRAQATTDLLTGLPNRRGFRQIIATGPRGGLNAVMVFDVDGLKRVNDTRGHEAGDAILVAVAEECRRVMRHGDVLARLGGDEFGAVLYGATEQEAIDIAERMLRALTQLEVEGCAPSVSIGIAASTAEVGDAMVAADAAMYEAKQGGGLRWTTAPAPAR